MISARRGAVSEEQDASRVLTKGGITREGGHIDLQLIAHSNVWNTQHRSQCSVYLGLFEMILPPQNFE